MSVSPAPPLLSTRQRWLLAVRPRTLTAGVMPVLIGSALAFADHRFHPLLAAAALLCATLIQIATNFINEIYDHRRGADTGARLGPTRTVAAGLIAERVMVRASAGLLLVACLLGGYLALRGGWPILLVGLLSVFFAWGYTGGPFPLAYRGLGDIFVLIFFGFVATVGTYYVQALQVPPPAFWVSLTPGALACNILAVNNVRDMATDRAAGKITLAVRLGERRAKALYTTLMALSFLPVPALLASRHSLWLLLPALAVPASVRVTRALWQSSGKALNPVLGGTARQLSLQGGLTALALVLSTL